MISASDELRVRYFSQSLTGSAFGWYTSLPPNSVQTWKQLEERFHEQYHSEASEAGIADLAQVRQKRGETVSEYIQRFRTVRNRCYSVHVSEKEAVELAVVGLSSSIKDVASQADYPSLAHMVQKLSAYEQRHPDVYQDKFKRVVTMVDAGEDEGATGEQEVAVAEWTRAAGPVTCKWVKPPGPPRGFDFDVTKTEQIFDLLLAEKHIKIPEGHKVPTVQELNGKPYCKWHNTFTHTTNDCRVWRQQIQMAIENGRLIFNQYAMKVDTHPFPAVNMVEFTHLGGCQPGFSANINMVELGHHSEKDGDEGSCSQSKDTEGAAPCDRLRQDGKRYVTEGEVKNIRYQRPLSDHLLNKYVSRSYLRAVTALVVAVVAAIGAAPGGLVVAPMAADRALVVFIFFVASSSSRRSPGARPGEPLGRRLIGGGRRLLLLLLFLLLHPLGGGEVVPGEASSLSSSDSPLARKRRSLSPSVEDWSSSDQMEKSWSDSSPAAMARRMLAAWTSAGLYSGVSRDVEDWLEGSDGERRKKTLWRRRAFGVLMRRRCRESCS
ncbi:hypothetical protein QYE76_019695 [Lolium multiflorum]|uniref:Retrotransposon gag domain-containing protein n=1 Tax=Lolium multiflorum TaxID=4521 RepID=A0AAD8VRG3_LOLMU|nr:hypothetical protein QYE76_019695 [Lolium multiflorum]